MSCTSSVAARCVDAHDLPAGAADERSVLRASPRRQGARRTSPSRCAAGCARAAIPRPAFPSSTCPTARASIRCRSSRRTTLPNYADEVLQLTAGCAVEATGTIVPSPAKGQPFEMQASAIKVVGWVEDPDSYPIQPKPHTLEFLREVAHLRPRTNVIGAVTRVRHTHRAVDPPLLPRERLLLGQHADHHRLRRRGRRRAVPRVDARSDEPAAHAGGQGRFRAGFLRARGVPHRVRPAQRRDLLHGAVQGLHVRADVSRRELEHQPAPRRVLDDRARDRVRRSLRQRHARRGAAQAHLPDACSPSAPTTWRSSRSASRRA